MRLHFALLGVVVCLVPVCVADAAWELYEQTRVEGKPRGVIGEGSTIAMQSGSAYEVAEVTEQTLDTDAAKVTVMRDGERFLVAIEGFSKALICKQTTAPQRATNHRKPRREPRITSPVTEIPVEQVLFKDLGPVSVLVEHLDEDEEAAGLSRDLLKSFVELKLRQSGIPVLDKESTSPLHPFVYVNLNARYLEAIDIFAYSNRISLRQAVLLPRNNNMVSASTWEMGLVGTTARVTLRDDAVKSLDALLVEFCNNYLAANSIEQTAGPTSQIDAWPSAISSPQQSPPRSAPRATSAWNPPVPALPPARASSVYWDVGVKHYVKEKIDRGAYILLDDGSLWEISQLDRIYTNLWLMFRDVIVVENRTGLLPYKLISEGDAVEAKLVGKR